MTGTIAGEVLIDIEMTDYNEMTDETAIRVSTTSGDVTIANGVVRFAEDGTPSVAWTDVVLRAGFQKPDTEQLAVHVLAAIEAERKAFPDCETLRDLFNNVIPSYASNVRATGLQM